MREEGLTLRNIRGGKGICEGIKCLFQIFRMWMKRRQESKNNKKQGAIRREGVPRLKIRSIFRNKKSDGRKKKKRTQSSVGKKKSQGQ